MAGAGYKLFNTGDVLTAAQVNTYLMEQTVMVFADAAARTAALSGVVSEGMISYLKDTNAVEVYNGSAWVASDDPNAIQNTIVDAKGDLITATAADTPARLAVGNNGETLVADSSASTGLRWQGSIAAGKNVVINGGMDFWQRGTSFSNAHGYNADRWLATGATAVPVQTISRQTLTAGDLAGTGLQYFWRQNVTNVNGATNISNQHRIEGVETFAGQTVTLSFYAKADSARTVGIQVNQNFGSGGSTDAAGPSGNASVTTSWTRFTFTGSLPSLSGKTIGTGSFVYIVFSMPVSTFTIDITGVQLELGSVATAFSRAGGTLAGELSLAQRYYELGRAVWAGAVSSGNTWGVSNGFKVQKRVTPTMTATSVADNNFNGIPVAGDQTVYSAMIKENADGTGDAYFIADWSASAEL